MSTAEESTVNSSARAGSHGRAVFRRVAATFRRVVLDRVFLFCLAVALLVVAFAQISGHNTRPIGSDGWGYYLPLPALFIYGDPSLSFLNSPDLPHDVSQYRAADGIWQGLSRSGSGYRDKYAVGTAVMEFPFFVAALAYQTQISKSANGFEMPFQLAIAISGAFYLALGCYLTYRAASLRYGSLASALAVVFALLATNLLYYGSFEGSFSHVYGFCLISGLLYLTIRRVDIGGNPRLWEFLLFGFLAGAAVMVRPTNVIVALLFIPFARQADFRRLAAGTALGFAASVLAASPQMLHWHHTTGDWIYYSYVGEGFNFLKPQLTNYLLSVKKGVFFWHPAYFLMIVALFSQLAVRPFETSIMIAIVALNLYIGASWGDPTFGDSFGCRQIVEMVPLLVLPTAAAVSWLLAGRWRWAAAGIASALIAVNLIQFYGYMVGALPHNHTSMESYVAFWADYVGFNL